MNNAILFSLDNRESLINSIISEANTLSFKIDIGEIKKYKFSDGEISLNFETSIRGKIIYLLFSPINSDDIMYLNLVIDAAKRAGAIQIIPILLYYPYSRQDKIDYTRGPIGAKIIAEMIEQRGATSLITFDLHADQIRSFFNIPVIHIDGKNVFDDYIYTLFHTNMDGNMVLAGPDSGSGKRIKRMKDQMQKRYGINLNYVMLDKTRKEANVIDDMIIIGDVTDKDVIILDDMIDTFGTADKAIDVLLENGARSVRMIASHGVLSGPAYDRINNSKIHELIVSDSLETKINNKIKIISVAKQIGMAIASINDGVSYEDLKNNNNNNNN